MKNAGLIGGGPEGKFIALFAFDSELGTAPEGMLIKKLRASIATNHDAVVTHLCVGRSSFVRYFAVEPETGMPLNRWRTYEIDGLAPGYFVANALRAVVGNTIDSTDWGWFDVLPPTESMSSEG